MMERLDLDFMVGSGQGSDQPGRLGEHHVLTQVLPLRWEIRGFPENKNSDSVAVSPHFFVGRKIDSAGLKWKGR